jgi:hypothetical protein
MGKWRGISRVLVGRLGERDHLGDSRTLEDNIKIDLQELAIGGMDWIELAQDRDR